MRVRAAAEEYQRPLHFALLLLHACPAMASLRCRFCSFHSLILCYASTKGKVILELEDHVRKLEKAVKEGRCVRVFADFSKFTSWPTENDFGTLPVETEKAKDNCITTVPARGVF